jgi:hypothetical protein
MGKDILEALNNIFEVMVIPWKTKFPHLHKQALIPIHEFSEHESSNFSHIFIPQSFKKDDNSYLGENVGLRFYMFSFHYILGCLLFSTTQMR